MELRRGKAGDRPLTPRIAIQPTTPTEHWQDSDPVGLITAMVLGGLENTTKRFALQ